MNNMEYVENVYKTRFKDCEELEDSCYYFEGSLYIILGNGEYKINEETSNEKVLELIQDIINW